jgi:4-carboxymuconolactone decarboxylase
MARIPLIDRKESLAPEHRAVYDAIAQSRGYVRGPFAALLHSPEIAGRTAHLGSYIRFESQLERKVLELAALVTARELLHSHRLSEATFQALYTRLGEAGLVELTATIGYYAMLACTLNAFDVFSVTLPKI